MRKTPLLLLFMLCALSLSGQEYLRMIDAGTYTVQEIQAEAEAYFAKVGTDKGRGYKPYKRWEYQALRTMDENGRIRTAEENYNELERYQNYLNQNGQATRSVLQGNWQELGPVNWNATSGWNPGVGRITSFAVEAGNNDHIIIGANSGGVWRTTNGGASWTPLSDTMATMSVFALAMNPSNSNEYFWGTSNGVIFKSSDAGATWNILADVGSGTVNKILIDPTNTDKMYCTSTGGIFKSTDAGANWTSIHASAGSGYDIEFKPGDTNVVYAMGSQFFRSNDGGATFNLAENTVAGWGEEFVSGTNSWQVATQNQNGTVAPQTGNGLALFYIDNFSGPVTRLVSPAMDLSGATAPELNFAYTQVAWGNDQDELRVMYKTSAAGAWTTLATYTSQVTSWADITLSLPSGSSEYYIAFEGTSNYGRGVTLDNISVTDATLGTVFEDGFEAANSYPFASGTKMMAVTPADPNVIYVLEESSGRFGGFYKSTDGGDSFTALDHGSNNYFGYSSTANDDFGQAPRDMDIIASPTDADEVHIAGILTWKSTNGGVSFNITSQWTPGNANNQNIGYCHADVDIMEYIGDKIYVGSDGGLFVANNPATVNSSYYTDLTTGLGIRQFYKIGISQSNPTLVSGGSQDNGTSIMIADGTWNDWLGADGMESFIDKDNNNIIYGTSQNGSLYRSTNGGNSYSGIGAPEGKSGNWITPFEQDPIAPNTIYSGYDQVYKSTNSGSTWTSISQSFGSNLHHLKIAPSNNNIMYAARGGTLYKTTNGGATNWSVVSGISGGINSIAIHPTDSDRVAVATNGAQKVYVTTDGGNNWSSLLLDLPNFSAQAVVWENNGNNGLYVGMNYGVYYTDDTLSEWKPFSTNLPNVNISELEINTVTNEIFVATYGRGLWKSNVFDPALNVESFELSEVQVYPNPTAHFINIKTPQSNVLDITLFDALGKIVYKQEKANANATISIDVSEYAEGLYFVRLSDANGAITKKVVIK